MPRKTKSKGVWAKCESDLDCAGLALDLTGLDWRLDWRLDVDWIGLDWIGLDWIGLDWVGLDWIGLDWVGMDLIGVRLCATMSILEASGYKNL